MKRSLLFIAYVLTSLAMSAQGSSYFDYVPFVKEGKKWTVVRSDFSSGYHFERYMLMGEEVVKDGKTYMKMYRSEDDMTVVYDAGQLREENRKVYVFDAERQAEFLAFDYSLKAGDTYETYSYDEQKAVTYRVLSVSDFIEGPKLLRESYDAAADSMTTQQRYLQKWVVCRTNDNSHQKTWIEGVGSLESPLANLSDARPISSNDYLAYVEYGDFDYLPFSFYDTLNRQIHGSNLPTGAEDFSEGGHHQLTYELEGNRLHVYGKAFTQCGPNNYAYFFEEPTDDPLVHKLRFVIQEVEPLMDCMALHTTDFYVPGFNPNISYIVVDNEGEEHPVINKTPQMAYRPFVEDDKVWKVGAVNSGNPVQLVEHFYFADDTIIDGKTCKQMMRQRYATPDYENTQQPSLSYVGAWYEESQRVYYYDEKKKEFQMMYDFSLNANDTLLINNQRYIVGPRQTGGLKGFKGVYRDVANYMGFKNTWLEGVGGLYGITTNVIDVELADPAWFLMSCTVGDEVIYLNGDYEDGATPETAGAAKARFDFTHTTKPKPRAPMMREAEQSLYGEYNEQRLGINFDPLDDAYLVRITNEAGKVVYEKAVNAGNIVALDIDISIYAKGRYTVTVENSRESFTGEFEAKATGIKEVSNKSEKAKSYIYNIQGQRLSSLQKGLNIVNGQKVFVK